MDKFWEWMVEKGHSYTPGRLRINGLSEKTGAYGRIDACATKQMLVGYMYEYLGEEPDNPGFISALYTFLETRLEQESRINNG